MAHRSWTLPVVIALVVVGVALAGCPEPEPVQQQAAMPEPSSAPAAEQPAIAEPAAEEPATEEAASPAEFEWTDSPTVADIPDGPITGVMHGRPFTAKTIRIEKKDEDTYQMQISNGELNIPDSITSTISNDDAWRFRFTTEEGAPVEMQWAIDDEKTFDDEHVYYYYDQGEGKPSMSVNGPWGAALQITEWTVEEPSEGSRIIGTMKGRVALVMRGTDKSWAAGTFEAPVYEW